MKNNVRNSLRQHLKHKKGQVGLSDVPNAVLLLGLSAVIGVIMLILLTNLEANDNVTTDSFAENASQAAQEGIGEIFDNFDLIGLMIGLGVVLVILLGVFAFVGARRAGVF